MRHPPPSSVLAAEFLSDHRQLAPLSPTMKSNYHENHPTALNTMIAFALIAIYVIIIL